MPSGKATRVPSPEERTSAGRVPTEEGYGRTDALARISNTVFGDHLGAQNYQVANAPVTFNFATGNGTALALGDLERLHALKTGALIRAAVRMGALCGAAPADAPVAVRLSTRPRRRRKRRR